MCSHKKVSLWGGEYGNSNSINVRLEVFYCLNCKAHMTKVLVVTDGFVLGNYDTGWVEEKDLELIRAED